MKEMLTIIGANGHGRVLADIALKIKKWKNISFLDDDNTMKKSLGLNVIGGLSDAYKYKNESDFIVGIGNNYTRRKIQDKILQEGFSIISLIHPSAEIGTNVDIGKGTAIMAGVVINNSTKIGQGCIINTSSSLDHDDVIGDYVHISPGSRIAGNVNIDNQSWIGIGSVVSNNLNICSDCKIGAGAVVVNNILDPGTYVGVPAKRVHHVK